MKRFAVALFAVAVALLFAGCGLVRSVTQQVLPQPAVVETEIEDDEEAEETPDVTSTATPEPEESHTAAAEEPDVTQEPEVSSTPVDATTGATPDENTVVSDTLGIAFTVPEDWAGKYRVEERNGYLSVYFVPSVPFDDSFGDGFIFTITKQTSEDDEYFLDNSRKLDINGVPYICGTSTDVSYSPEQPEYEIYEEMFQDYSDIMETIRAAE